MRRLDQSCAASFTLQAVPECLDPPQAIIPLRPKHTQSRYVFP